MPRMEFTDPAIRAIKPPAEGRVEYWDTKEGYAGFGLRVSCLIPQPDGTPPKGGSKVFMVRYRTGGQQRRYKLGRYPRISLADARKQALAALRAVELGDDPAAARAERLKASTFKELAKLYLADISGGLSDDPDKPNAKPKKKAWKRQQQILNREFIPTFGSKKAGEIERAEFRTHLAKLADRAPISANRALEVVRRLYNWGMENDHVKASPIQGIKKLAAENRDTRWLTADEVKALWLKLDEAEPAWRAFFRLCLLTGQRPGEVATMRPQDIDGDWWTIPAERSKNGKAHAVYLSELARTEIEAVTGEGDWLFPHNGGALTDTAWSKSQRALRGDLDIPHWTTDDLRATAATHMRSEPLSIDETTVAKVLNHHGGGITGQYVRHGYDAEKKRALTAWGRRVEQILTGKADKVVRIA